DLGPDHQLMCNYYTFRQDGSKAFMRHWNFQGSSDGKNWTNLRVHENDQTIVIVAMAVKCEIEKLSGNNFSLWKLKMKAILKNDKSLAAISERLAEVTDDSKWDEMDENAIANLIWH
nr:BTB/POZ domain-containing protein At2g30600 [Tanacetum cinerariifolium]